MSARLPARLPGRSPARRAARWPAALALAAAVGLTAAACSSSSGSTSAAPPSASGGGAGVPAAVSTHGTTNLGTVFADSSGRTLYAADQEAGGKISCTGGCLQFWHPVLATAGASSTGGSGFGSVERPDTGKSQLTYSGKPVYTFAEDAAPGDTKGDGAKDAFGGKQFTWHALPANPSAATSAPPASTGSGSSGGSGGGYGY